MEDLKKKSMTETDKEIVFSKAIKAGKRIYYVDVRKNKKDDMFLAITESKKIITGEGNAPSISFEKHKIFQSLLKITEIHRTLKTAKTI